MPGDPPFAATAPADGAVVAPDPDGILVEFTCPLYRIADAGFPIYGGAGDYGVSMSRSSELGPDGRLADRVAGGVGTRVPGTSDRCTSSLYGGGSPPRPEETPGTYFWQVWRLRTGCPLGYETGPVLRLTLRSPAAPRLRLPKRVYAGFPFIASESVPARCDPARRRPLAGRPLRSARSGRSSSPLDR